MLDDPVKQYLSEIGNIPLLSLVEEQYITKAIAEGQRAKDILDGNHVGYEIIPDTKEVLEQKVRAGERAKKQLIEANLRLVVSVAKKHTGRGLLLLDLIQEGNMGLMKAVDKFDPTKGFKFSTYAVWWIRQAITRSIADHGRVIRIPVHMVETINKFNKVERQLTVELDHDPTEEELSEKLGWTVDRVREIRRISQGVSSLDSPVGDEEGSVLSDFVEDLNTIYPRDIETRVIANLSVEKALDSCTESELELISFRFGLNDGQLRTIDETATNFQLSRAEVRKIEAKFLVANT